MSANPFKGPKRDYRHREGEGAHRAVEIQREARECGVTDADLFIAFASVVTAYNPRVGRLCLDALSNSVLMRASLMRKAAA